MGKLSTFERYPHHPEGGFEPRERLGDADVGADRVRHRTRLRALLSGRGATVATDDHDAPAAIVNEASLVTLSVARDARRVSRSRGSTATGSSPHGPDDAWGS